MKRAAASGKGTIRRFIIVWMCCLVGCLVLMSAALILSTNALQAMNSRIFHDSKSLELAHRLEAAILGQRRESLLFRITGDEGYITQKHAELTKAEEIVPLMKNYTTSRDEKETVYKIFEKFDEFTKAVADEGAIPAADMSRITDNLLALVERFREVNRKQMENTIRRSESLNIFIDRCSISITILVILIAATGAAILINRLIQPILGLSKTAREFGSGNFSARADVLRDDEMGMLCETFNDMAEDISELHRERLNLAASITHDLNNPLMVIGGAAYRLRSKLALPDEYSKWLDRIIEKTRHLERLSHDLMDAMQIETGKLDLTLSDVELASLLKEIHQTLKELTTTHDIVIESDCECRIKGDRDRIERVITNIINNALKYSPRESTVYLALEAVDGQAVISVRDEGIGISGDKIDELFKPFKRLDGAKEMARGSGLGLFSAAKIIENHGGEIKISSEENRGTTVLVILPLAPQDGEKGEG